MPARRQLNRLADTRFVLVHNRDTERHLCVRTDAKAHVVRRRLNSEERRWTPEPRDDLGVRRVEFLARADEDRHALPAPIVDRQPHGRERLHLRIVCHTSLAPVAEELTADHIARPQRGDRFQYLHLLIAHRLAVDARWWLHHESREHLKHMVLDHVADCAGLVIECAAILHTERLGHGHLDAVNVLPVPERFVHWVADAKEQQVVHRSLAEVVIDAKNSRLIEGPEQNTIEVARALNVATKGFLDDDPGAKSSAAAAGELLDDFAEKQRRNGEIERGTLRRSKGLLESLKGGSVRVVTVDVAQQLAELRGRCRIEAAVLFEALAHARLQLLASPTALGDADDRDIQDAALHHCLQRGEYLLVGEISGGPEKDQCITV